MLIPFCWRRRAAPFSIALSPAAGARRRKQQKPCGSNGPMVPPAAAPETPGMPHTPHRRAKGGSFIISVVSAEYKYPQDADFYTLGLRKSCENPTLRQQENRSDLPSTAYLSGLLRRTHRDPGQRPLAVKPRIGFHGFPCFAINPLICACGGFASARVTLSLIHI